MRQSADMQDGAKRHRSRRAYLPSRELLGEMLLELKRPAEALKEFELSLAHDPNRRRSLRGAQEAKASLARNGG